MLATPYEGPAASDISSLFQRNSLVRPVRQSINSDSSRRFPQAFTPPSTPFGNFVQQPIRQSFRKTEPPRQSTQRPVRQPVRKKPTRQTVQKVQRRPQPTFSPESQFPSFSEAQAERRRPPPDFSPESQFPSFSEAQAEHKRTSIENANPFTNADGFFESSRIRERRDVTSRQVAPAADGREDKESHQGFMPNNFPSFQSIGGFDRMPDEADQSSNSFVPDFKPPQISIPDIEEDQPKFSIPSHFSQQVSSTQQGKPKRETQSQHQSHITQSHQPSHETQSNFQSHVTQSHHQSHITQSHHPSHHFKIQNQQQQHQQRPHPHQDQTQLQPPQNFAVHTDNPLETHPDEELTLFSPTPDLSSFHTRPNLNTITNNPKFPRRNRPKRPKNRLNFLNPFNILGSSRSRNNKLFH
ncbi:unnamed protein product [Meganyctiphanes norvegica]|uniref:Uncharacterized protein n=1 Tax=Meganyctiphanes norvegica TaxID=48144 RepID=A0AAV2RXY0_MEGNR